MNMKRKIQRIIDRVLEQPFIIKINEIRAKDKELLVWGMSGRQIPSGNTYKRAVIAKFAQKFRITNFVETGTFLGGTVEAVLNLFQQIYSIEVEPKLFADAKEKFSSYKHVQIIQGDSSEQIKNILANLDRPALFWLDAHYSAGITGKAKEDSALRAEVVLISEHINKTKLKHVMLLDDARDFTGNNGYPTVSEVIMHVKENLPGYTVELRDDIVRIYPPIKGKLFNWN